MRSDGHEQKVEEFVIDRIKRYILTEENLEVAVQVANKDLAEPRSAERQRLDVLRQRQLLDRASSAPPPSRKEIGACCDKKRAGEQRSQHPGDPYGSGWRCWRRRYDRRRC